MKTVEVYTDGSATIASSPGGYGWVILVDGIKHSEGNGYMSNASNNDAELEAAIQGLAAAYRVTINNTDLNSQNLVLPETFLISDSRLVLGWASGHYKFKQVNKMDQFHKLRALIAKMKVKTRWVRGHNGDEHNERCDKLANEARTGIEKKQKKELAVSNGETVIGTKKTSIVCLWHKGTLKIVDLDQNIVENYNRDIHGPRGSMLEIREEKSR